MEESHPSSPHAINTAHTGGNQRRHRSVSSHHDENSNDSEPPKLVKTPRIKDLVEMVWKQTHEDTP